MNSARKKYYKDYRSDESLSVPRRTYSRWKQAKVQPPKPRESVEYAPVSMLETASVQNYSKEDVDDFHDECLVNVRSFHSHAVADFKCHAYEAFNDPALEEVNLSHDLREETDFQTDEVSDDDSQEIPDIMKDSSDAQESTSMLYQGASLTVVASILLIMAFALKHSLTGEALADLLLLIEVHCLSPNQCKKNCFTVY